MKTCDFEYLFDEYITGQLPPDEDIAFQRHLGHCRTCPSRLESYYSLHHLLFNQHPAGLSEEAVTDSRREVLKTLHRRLDNIPRPPFRQRLPDIILHPGNIWIRLAGIAVLLLVGLFIGWLLFGTGQEPPPPGVYEPGWYNRSISGQDLDYMNYYFLASEMVLLEIKNSDGTEQDSFIDNSTAQKLLMKTFIVHELALQLNDPGMLRFLGQMELILYELSNVEPGEMLQTMESIRVIIDEAHMLDEIRGLQKILKNPGSNSVIPG